MKAHDETDDDKFRAHLDECERCRNRPFDLCWTGKVLLEATNELPFSILTDGHKKGTVR